MVEMVEVIEVVEVEVIREIEVEIEDIEEIEDVDERSELDDTEEEAPPPAEWRVVTPEEVYFACDAPGLPSYGSVTVAGEGFTAGVVLLGLVRVAPGKNGWRA